MRLLIIILIFYSVEIRADCLQVDQCIKNITETFLTFGDYYSQIMFRARDYVRDLIPKFKLTYRALNMTVLAGPETCRDKHLMTKKMGYYFKDAMNMCLVPEPDPNPEDVQNIKNFNEQFLAGDDDFDRVRYCKHLVPYFNIYCRYLDDVMATADNCNVLNNFELLFKSKWLKCSSNVNSTKSILKYELLPKLTKKLREAVLKRKIIITSNTTNNTTNLFTASTNIPRSKLKLFNNLTALTSLTSKPGINATTSTKSLSTGLVGKSYNLTTTTPRSKLKLLPGLTALTRKVKPTTVKPSITTTSSTMSIAPMTGLFGKGDKLI